MAFKRHPIHSLNANNNMHMKILIVALSENIHTVRWLAQIADQGWDIHLFPSADYGYVHPEIRNTTVYHSFYDIAETKKKKLTKLKGVQLYYRPFAVLARQVLNKFFPEYRKVQLQRLIKKLKPDIIHSLEFQHAAYLTLEAKKNFRKDFPPWIATNWGSDIYLFGRMKDHKPKIRAVLKEADYYSCECNRDVVLAKDFGFKGKVLPVFPNTGGFDMEEISYLRQSGKVSSRRIIMLKGYQSWAGRALVGLRALERCADILAGYEVIIYLAVHESVIIAAELFSESTGVPVNIIPKNSPHSEILHFHGKARISIGLSISDAVSTSFLEAITMGAFPIQSWTACADEWIEDGRTGFLVQPDDPEDVEAAIRHALADDALVDQAAVENADTCRARLDKGFLKEKAIELYLTVAKEKGIQNVN